MIASLHSVILSVLQVFIIIIRQRRRSLIHSHTYCYCTKENKKKIYSMGFKLRLNDIHFIFACGVNLILNYTDLPLAFNSILLYLSKPKKKKNDFDCDLGKHCQSPDSHSVVFNLFFFSRLKISKAHIPHQKKKKCSNCVFFASDFFTFIMLIIICFVVIVCAIAFCKCNFRN